MLRLACCLATERGIQVCAPVHRQLGVALLGRHVGVLPLHRARRAEVHHLGVAHEGRDARPGREVRSPLPGSLRRHADTGHPTGTHANDPEVPESGVGSHTEGCGTNAT